MTIYPNPRAFTNWKDWAEQLLFGLKDESTEGNPRSINLEHVISGFNDKYTEGLTMYNPGYGVPVVGGSSSNLVAHPSIACIEYQENSSTDGSTLSSGANVIDLATLSRDRPWFTHDAVQGTFNLLDGTYYIHGMVAIARNTTLNSVGAKVFLADFTAQTTELGDVASNSFYFPASADSRTHTINFEGFLTSISNNTDYALICETTGANLRLGFQHGLTKTNTYAKLLVQLLELS